MAQSFLPSSTLAELATISESALDRMALVVTRVRVPDGRGGWSETETTVEVPCRVYPPRQRSLEEAGARGILSVTLWELAFPLGTPLTTNADVVVDDRRYNLEAVLSDHTFQVMTRALATRVD